MFTQQSDAAVKTWAVVPAAGIGARVGGDIPKQYLKIKRRTILEITLDKLLNLTFIQGIVVVLNAGDQWWQNLSFANHPRIFTTQGGAERAHSVLAGLAALKRASAKDWVMVHDAARPCVTLDKLKALHQAAREHAVGAILAAPVADTLKRINDNFEIENTELRHSVWQAHTPQMFPLGLLMEALNSTIESGNTLTDEAAAIESLGMKPLVVEDRRDNIKVTVREDLAWAQAILQLQSSIGR